MEGGVELIGHKEVAVLEQHHGPRTLHGNHRKPPKTKKTEDFPMIFFNGHDFWRPKSSTICFEIPRHGKPQHLGNDPVMSCDPIPSTESLNEHQNTHGVAGQEQTQHLGQVPWSCEELGKPQRSEWI